MNNIKNLDQSNNDILNDLDFLSEILTEEGLTFNEQIKAAAVIQEIIITCQALLIPFKVKLRQLGKASGESKFEAFTKDGEVCAAVITPKKSYKLNTSFNVSEAIQLPEFESLIEERTTYKLKKGAAETILSMNSETRDQWMSFIEKTNPSSRVSLNFVK